MVFTLLISKNTGLHPYLTQREPEPCYCQLLVLSVVQIKTGICQSCAQIRNDKTPRPVYVTITIYDDMNRLLSINQKKMEISPLLEKGILEIILKIHLLTFRQLYFSKFLSNVHSINSSVQTYITHYMFVFCLQLLRSISTNVLYYYLILSEDSSGMKQFCSSVQRNKKFYLFKLV